MTKERLENYIYLKGELNDLYRERKMLERKASEPVSDTVQGSAPEFPFNRRTVKITGIDTAANKALRRKIKQIELLEQKIEAEQKEIRLWIDELKDVRVRRLMRYRYIERMGWISIAAKLDYNSADAARKAHARFLEKK